MKKTAIILPLVEDLLYQALETELGGIQIYEAALACVIHPDLKHEFQHYLDQTHEHRDLLLQVFGEFGLDPDARTPSREIVASIAQAYLSAMQQARRNGDPEAAQRVATECVCLAETKDHFNWELIGQIVKKVKGSEYKSLKEAFEKVEPEENHHLYHTKGWLREIWIDNMGMPAVLPPPEEIKQVETAIGASRAELAREKLLSS